MRLLLTALLIAAPAAAQSAAPAAPAAPANPAAAMSSSLRNLVTLQEKYYAEHGTYTTDAKALGTYPGTKGVPMAQVIFAGGRGWSGIAVDRVAKISCVIYVGSPQELPALPKTQFQGRAAVDEAKPVCDTGP